MKLTGRNEEEHGLRSRSRLRKNAVKLASVDLSITTYALILATASAKNSKADKTDPGGGAVPWRKRL